MSDQRDYRQPRQRKAPVQRGDLRQRPPRSRRTAEDMSTERRGLERRRPERRGTDRSGLERRRSEHSGRREIAGGCRPSSAQGRRATTPCRSAAAASAPMVIDVRWLLIALAVVILVVVLVVRGCSSPAPDISASAVTSSSASQEAPAPPEPEADWEEVSAAVYSLLDDDYAEALLQAAQTDADARWIACHTGDYTEDGSIVQYKLLKLAALEPQARPFVRNWPELYSQDKGEPCDSSWSGRVPHLYQWDPRWGYTLYCSTTFALTGCCPTSFAMVYQALTGAADQSPYDMGVLASSWGYMDEMNGTDVGFFFAGADEFGFSCWQISTDSYALTSTLASGNLVICNVGPGDFTTGGHFIVLAGLDGNGDLVVNDPFSVERSNRSWDVDMVLSQTKALYAFSW